MLLAHAPEEEDAVIRVVTRELDEAIVHEDNETITSGGLSAAARKVPPMTVWRRAPSAIKRS